MDAKPIVIRIGRALREQGLEAVMIGNAADRFDANGNLTDDITKDYIRKLLQAHVEWTSRIQKPAPG